MLVRHYIVFVFWIRRLVLGWDVDEFVGEVRGAVEFFEDVGVTARMQVDVGVGAVFGLDEEGGYWENHPWGMIMMGRGGSGEESTIVGDRA